MNFLANLISSLRAALYIVLGIAGILVYGPFLCHNVGVFGVPIGHKVDALLDSRPQQRPAKEKEVAALGCGLLMTGTVSFIVLCVVTEGAEDSTGRSFMEALPDAVIKMSMEQVLVMGFLRAIAEWLLRGARLATAKHA